MNVCVFCSAREVNKTYTDAAIEFAKLLADAGHTLVCGGTREGTMKLIAQTAQQHGAKVIGIAMELVRSSLYEGADELIVEETLMERKATMLKRSDAFVAMPGGIGTLDEVTEILELKKHVHNKPVIILNTGDFYGGFKTQLERMGSENFLPRPPSEFAVFANTPAEAMSNLK